MKATKFLESKIFLRKKISLTRLGFVVGFTLQEGRKLKLYTKLFTKKNIILRYARIYSKLIYKGKEIIMP